MASGWLLFAGLASLPRPVPAPLGSARPWVAAVCTAVCTAAMCAQPAQPARSPALAPCLPRVPADAHPPLAPPPCVGERGAWRQQQRPWRQCAPSSSCCQLERGSRRRRGHGGAGCGPVFASVRAAGPSGPPPLLGGGGSSRGWTREDCRCGPWPVGALAAARRSALILMPGCKAPNCDLAGQRACGQAGRQCMSGAGWGCRAEEESCETRAAL